MQLANNIYELEGLGTHWWFESLEPSSISDNQKQVITNELQRFSLAYSRFNDKSDISHLNKNGFINNPTPEMVQMFEFARKMYHDTDGVFNVFVGGILESLGYGSKDHGLTDIHNIWSKVQISRDKIIIPSGYHVDFGGFGKGWLINSLSKLVVDGGINNFIINGGGDIYVKSPEPIEFALEDPINPSLCLGSIKITQGALAASSTKKRSWIKDGKTVHHIIDPTKKTSAKGPIIASFVKADSALIADVIATCLIVRPEIKSKLQKHFDFEAIVF